MASQPPAAVLEEVIRVSARGSERLSHHTEPNEQTTPRIVLIARVSHQHGLYLERESDKGPIRCAIRRFPLVIRIICPRSATPCLT
jgi:hypothetical protein